MILAIINETLPFAYVIIAQIMIKFIGTTNKDGEILLYYFYTKNNLNFFKRITSQDGFAFGDKSKYVSVTDGRHREVPTYDWSYFCITKQKDNYVSTYKVNTNKQTNLIIAKSLEILRWEKIATIENIHEAGALIPDYHYKNNSAMYFGEKTIKLAYSSQYTTWKIIDTPVLEGRSGYFDAGELQVARVFNQEKYILVLYYVKKTHSVGAAAFDKKEPSKLLWRLDSPLWEVPNELKQDTITPLGIEMLHDQFILYWIINDSTLFAVSCWLPSNRILLRDKHITILLKKHKQNPIISPQPKNKWESRATFNTAAIYEDGEVHFVYRALGDSDLSVLGYAKSKDGFTIDERSDEPIYIPRERFETPGGNVFATFADHFSSGGGYGGIEDPRITKIDDTVYMTYVAFDGANPPRVALTSISLEDFLHKQWDKWKKPKLISAPGMVNKNAVIFPEKINSKYVVYHRIYPNILVDVVDDLNFDDSYLQGKYFIAPRKQHWDSKKIGAGAPPIKTKDGWLFIYQSVGYQDPHRYKIGAMLLDKDDPTKVLYRANNPIISPDENYENEGFKAGIAYPCGAVVKDNTLIVYYGGADTVVCAASENLDTFLNLMKYNQEPKLKRVTSSLLS